MRLRRLAVATVVAGAVLGGCGGDDDVADVVPRSTPELTVPAATTGLEAGQTSTTPTTPTTTTPTPGTPAPSAPGAAGGAAAPVTPGATGGAPATGGTQTPPTGGAPATGGEQFQDFCAENPGACPGG